MTKQFQYKIIGALGKQPTNTLWKDWFVGTTINNEHFDIVKNDQNWKGASTRWEYRVKETA